MNHKNLVIVNMFIKQALPRVTQIFGLNAMPSNEFTLTLFESTKSPHEYFYDANARFGSSTVQYSLLCFMSKAMFRF